MGEVGWTFTSGFVAAIAAGLDQDPRVLDGTSFRAPHRGDTSVAEIGVVTSHE